MTASVASETASGKQAEDANAFAAEIAAILTADALPGETDGFSEEDGGAAAAFVAQTASRRAAGQPSVEVPAHAGSLEKSTAPCREPGDERHSAASPAARISASGAAWPVMSSNCRAAWCTRRSRPPTKALPWTSARSASGVGHG